MTRFNTLLWMTLAVIIASNHTLAASAEVNLYSARKEALIKPLLDQFTQHTGIQVNLVTGKADALLKRLETEGQNSPADLLITTDAGRLHRAKIAGVLQPIVVPHITGDKSPVHPNLRDPEGYWVALSVRARPIFYAKDRVRPEQLSSYEALADKEWQGRICIRSSSNIYNQSLVASMIAHSDETQTEAWANGFVANFARPPKGGDRDQIKAVAAGRCDIAIANTYYFAQMLSSDNAVEVDAANAVELLWPNQADRGAHINISGIGLTAHAKNRDNAIKLIEYLIAKEAQAWYAQSNHEYPAVTDVEPSEILAAWGDFQSDQLNLSQLGELNAAAVRLMDRAGWR